MLRAEQKMLQGRRQPLVNVDRSQFVGDHDNQHSQPLWDSAAQERWGPLGDNPDQLSAL